MFHVLKNNPDWAGTASIQNLKQRAAFLKATRQFFDERGLVEVDTPLLCRGVATDPCLHAFSFNDNFTSEKRFLQTSPEFAMKRLLAANSGPIYYLGKAFRQEEVGAKHNPEFTILEWYRPNWDHYQLISEVDSLFQTLLQTKPAVLTTYKALFETHFSMQPHYTTAKKCQEIAQEKGWIAYGELSTLDVDGWLDFLFTKGIEPHLGHEAPVVVMDYPASQASLAKIKTIAADPEYQVADRFEFYYKGFELANGYHELTCPIEQIQRFETDMLKRKILGLPMLPIDKSLIAAMEFGLPDCAGVALGFDRLLMLKLGEGHIETVLPFAWQTA